MAGFYAAFVVLAALYERETTGKGRKVETSMFEALSHFNMDDFTHYLSEGEIMGLSSRPHVSQSYMFECADSVVPPPELGADNDEVLGRK